MGGKIEALSVTHDVKKLIRKFTPWHFLLYCNNSSEMPKSGFERSEKAEYIREMIHLSRAADDTGICSEEGKGASVWAAFEPADTLSVITSVLSHLQPIAAKWGWQCERESTETGGDTLLDYKTSTTPSKFNLQWKVWLFDKKKSDAWRGGFTLKMNVVGGFVWCCDVLSINQHFLFFFHMRFINNWRQWLSDEMATHCCEKQNKKHSFLILHREFYLYVLSFSQHSNLELLIIDLKSKSILPQV